MSTARPPYSLFRVVVERVEWITPHMKRITIDGSCLSDFRFGLPAQWLKVFVPEADGQNIVGRAYTVRRFDPASKKLELDFVLHGDNGPASAWAARAQVGDAFEISAAHPRSGFPIQPSTEQYLLFGDETALPAIGAILEALPPHARARAFVEVADAGEEQTIEAAARVNFTWLHRKSSGQAVSGSPESGRFASGRLESAAKALGVPGYETVIWVAAESSIAKAIRKHALLVWGVDRSSVHAVGYWKRGESDHKDEEGAA